jgi:hypothetical protein
MLSGEDHSRAKRMGGMELLVAAVFFAIGVYVLYWTIRYAVRHALADADERRNGLGPNHDQRRSIGS